MTAPRALCPYCGKRVALRSFPNKLRAHSCPHGAWCVTPASWTRRRRRASRCVECFKARQLTLRCTRRDDPAAVRRAASAPRDGRQFRVSGAAPCSCPRGSASSTQPRRAPPRGTARAWTLASAPAADARAGDARARSGDRTLPAAISRRHPLRVRSSIEGPAREPGRAELDDLDAPTVAAWVAAWRAARRRRRRASRGARCAPSCVAAERGLVERCPWGARRPSSRVASAAGRAGLEQREACRTAEERNRLIVAARFVAWRRMQGRRGLTRGPASSELAQVSWSDVVPGALLVRGSKGTPLARLEVSDEVTGALADWANVLHNAGLFASGGRSSIAAGPRGPVDHGSRGVYLRARARAAVARAEPPPPERWSPHSLRDSFTTNRARRPGRRPRGAHRPHATCHGGLPGALPAPSPARPPARSAGVGAGKWPPPRAILYGSKACLFQRTEDSVVAQ